MSELKSKIIDYNETTAHCFPEEFKETLDDCLIAQTGADSNILLKLGAKIILKITAEDEEQAAIELAAFEIDSGYRPDLHLYVLGGRVYVEDDYDWNEIPDRAQDDARTVYTDAADLDDLGGGEMDDEMDGCDDDYDDYDDYEASPLSSIGRVSAPYDSNIFSVNYFEEYYRNNAIVYEPLVVNNFNLDHPILKIEKAYRNALCEIESYPSCGWIVLFHEGHFYIPVEAIEDPVNHDTFYYVKIFNSYPVAVTSGRVSVLAGAEVFNQTYTIGVRYRAGFCINWRKLFTEHLLPSNYLDLIPDLYTVTDKPYGSAEYRGKNTDYDGFNLQDDDYDD